jgi:alpha,alpha-trehalase
LGLDKEASDYFYFLTDLAEEQPDLQIMYGIGGERELTEEILDHLSGYEGARPVRIGNGAWDQRQHDVWGVVLDSVHLHIRSGDELDERRWPVLARQVEAALETWREPDQGIWEVRGPPKHFTSSKVLCWVAADRGAKLAELRGDGDVAARWRAGADEIHADVCANGTDDRGVFCQHYDTTALDASALLIVLLGFLPPDDPRARNGSGSRRRAHARRAGAALSRRRDRRRLQRRRGHVHDLLVLARLRADRDRRGGACRALCTKLLSYASPLLLYAEEIDPHTGLHLGNFPQAFTHLALINAVVHLIEEDQRLVMRGDSAGGPALPRIAFRRSGRHSR